MSDTTSTVQLVGVGGTAPYTFSIVPSGTSLPSSVTFSLTSAASAVGGSTTYSGTFIGGGSNAFAGILVTITGFTNASNNGQFSVSGSSTASITVINSFGVAESASAQAVTVVYTAPVFVNPTTSTLTVNTTAVSAGDYVLDIDISDSNGLSSNKVIDAAVVNPAQFAILNQDLDDLAPSTSPYTIALTSNAGVGTVTWALIPAVTTLPGVTLTSNNLTFTINGFGSWTVGVTATDSAYNSISKVLQIEALSPQIYTLVDGQVEILVTPPPQKAGINSFTITVTDSNSTVLTLQDTYKVDETVSAIYLDDFAFNYYWGAGDDTTVVVPISGNLAGYTIDSQSFTLSNGLIVEVDGVNNVVSVNGPPDLYANSQGYIQLPLLQSGNQVATITREYTLLSHDNSSVPVSTDVGTVQCFTRPYIVGDFVGLNPLKPWVNSPSISKGSYLARVATTSSLPPGLSLDANTGLIYGTLTGVASSQSIIQHYDANGVVHATITIVWDTQLGAFTLQDNLVDGNLQQTYTGSIGSPSGMVLTTASVYRGRLPYGLSLSTNSSGTAVNVVGSPTEAGYFDLWFRVTNSSSQSAYLYHRLVIDYANPLVILTSSLPSIITSQSYETILQGFGGVQPYTWSLDSTSPALPSGITLSPSTGAISGITAATSYSQTLVIDLRDSSFPTPIATQTNLLLAINNQLTILTTTLPKIQLGQTYSFTMSASGGFPFVSPPNYHWSTTSTLPVGITLSEAGVISGVTTSSYSQSINITVSDTVTSVSGVFLLQTGVSDMYINTSGVGSVDRGVSYSGTLQVYGEYTAPVTWQVASSSPNPLPSGLVLHANSTNAGVTAYILGTTTAVFSNYPVSISAGDVTGQQAVATVLLNSATNLLVTTTSLPVGIATANYSYQLAASGGVPPYGWSIVSGSLPSGYSLSSSGLISGSTGTTGTSTPTFQVTDSLSPANAATAQLSLTVQPSGLAITTASLPNVIAGRSYSQALAASGGVAPYTWSISPSSANQLPTGLTLNASTGIISGTTSVIESVPVTFRVTDNTTAYIEATFTLTVISSVALLTGVDYTDGTSTGCLGYIDNGSVASISPRPNYSFYVVATGVVTTNLTTLQSGIVISNSGFTATVTSLIGGVAYISLSGLFSSGNAGANTFIISVTDSGVTVTGTFTWVVYNDGTLSLAATNAFPTQLVSA